MCKAIPPERLGAQLKAPPSTQQPQKSVVFFHMGRMKFGFHGVFGILASLATWWAMQDESKLSIFTSCFFSSLVSYWASTMMHMVPPDTKIYGSKVVAPHVDAFTMTVYLVYYINVRCLRPFLPSEIIYKGLLVLAYWPFVPKKRWDFTNLNTWIFGIPRLLGVTYDFGKAFFGESTIPTHDLLFIVESLLLASFAYSGSFRLRGPPDKTRYNVVSRIVYVTITGMMAYLLGSIVWPDVIDTLSYMEV